MPNTIATVQCYTPISCADLTPASLRESSSSRRKSQCSHEQATPSRCTGTTCCIRVTAPTPRIQSFMNAHAVPQHTHDYGLQQPECTADAARESMLLSFTMLWKDQVATQGCACTYLDCILGALKPCMSL